MNCVYSRFGIFLFISLQLNAMNNEQSQPQSPLAIAAEAARSANEAAMAAMRTVGATGTTYAQLSASFERVRREQQLAILVRGFNLLARANTEGGDNGVLEAIAQIPPVAIAGQNDEEILNAIIPELSGTDEEIHACLQRVRSENGILENQQPVNQQLTDDGVCAICGNEFKNLEAHNSVRVTNCCHQLICQHDVDQIDKIAYNLFSRGKDQAFRRVYSQRNGPKFWAEIKPLGVCPFCRHYPFSTSPNS